MKPFKVLDINCDVGEGLNNEEAIMPYMSSCSIACGGHAGDEKTMKEVIRLALHFNVKIGAHPSYPDKENFGRKSMLLAEDDFIKTIRAQVHSLHTALKVQGGHLHHIKAHGALYNDLAIHAELAEMYLNALSEYKKEVIFYVPYGSVIGDLAARRGFKTWIEAFGDRNYNPNLTLVSRSLPNAVIKDANEVCAHIVRMAEEGKVKTIDGSLKSIQARTYCIHSDTDNAERILEELYKTLIKSGYEIR